MTEKIGRLIRGCGLLLLGTGLLLAPSTASGAQKSLRDGEASTMSEASQQYWEDSYGSPGCSGTCGGYSCCKIVML